MIQTISKEILKNNLFNKWKENHFQKRYDDEKGKKYFINIVLRPKDDFIKFNWWSITFQFENCIPCDGTVSFELTQWFNDNGRYSGKTIEDVEKYVEWCFITHGKPYYEIF